MPQTISALATLVGGTASGDADVMIHRVAGLGTAGPGDITFIEKAAGAAGAEQLRASCVIIPQDFEGELPFPTIKAKAPKLAFAMVAEVLHPPHREAGIHPAAIVAATARLGKGVSVGAGASIGEGAEIGEGCQIAEGVRIGRGVKIGADTFLYPNAVIYTGVSIGARCVIHAGTAIGADGFGYVRGRAGYTKFPQIGTVVIEDEVEIGANSCVDRGALGETRIGRGTKIDNLVQVAHNVQIGERVVIAAQTGISGSTSIGSDCVIGGQVGLGDHARVLSGAIIGSQAGILPGKIVRPGVWWGTPVQPLADFKKQHAQGKNVGALLEELRELRRVVEEMRGKQ